VGTTIEFPVRLTPRARRTLEAAVGEANQAGAIDFVGVEHIFLAILRDARSVPAQVVARLGHTAAIMEELERVLRSDNYRRRLDRPGLPGAKANDD
jgi:ATP-dependent Clp protease ATP-binding subunit ClpA